MSGIYIGSNESASAFLHRVGTMKKPRRPEDQRILEISIKIARERLAAKGIHESGFPAHPFAEELADGTLKPHGWVDDDPGMP